MAINDYILYTKLQPPPITFDIIARYRLSNILDAGRSRPLTLISAPAGYGKSTLASRWVTTCGRAYGWVSLDREDNDLRQFLRYLLSAIQQLFPENELYSKTLLEGDNLPASDELARYLLNDLHHISEPFNLVLDDYHLITNRLIHDLISMLLKHPAENMHLILVTRQDPPLAITPLRARGLVTDIRAADLRFTPSETADLFSRMLKNTIDESIVKLLDKKLEGWAAGLRLTSLYLKNSNDIAGQIRRMSASSTHITEYLMSEVLENQAPDTVDFLVKTAILDRFCPPLYERFHRKEPGESIRPGEVHAQKIISLLLHNNLFIIPLDDQGNWFRYHNLFQDFLKNILLKKYTEEQIKDLHRMAGNWFAENDLIEEAIHHMLKAGETSMASQLVVDCRHVLLNSSRFVLLNRWLSLLPNDAVAKTPLLLTTKAFTGIELGKDDDIVRFYERASHMLEGLSPGSKMYDSLQAEVWILQSFMCMFMEDAHNGVDQAQRALDFLPEINDYIRSLGIGLLAVCQQMEGDTDKAIAMIKKMRLDITLKPNIEARLYFYLCLVHYMNCNLRETMDAAQKCIQAVGTTEEFNHTRTFAEYFLGVAYYMQNQSEKAETFLLKVLADIHIANPSYVANSGILLAAINFSRRDESAVDQIIERVSTHCRNNNYSTPFSIIRAFEVELILRRGDTQLATRMCKQLNFELRPPIWFHYIPQLTPIKSMLAMGTSDTLKRAHSLLLDLDKRMNRIHRKNIRIEILILLAIVNHKQKNDSAALEYLETALRLAEPGGWIRIFVDLGTPVAEVLERLIAFRSELTFAQTVLSACRAEQDNTAAVPPQTISKGDNAGFHPDNIFTAREFEMFPLLEDGLSNREIAERLNVSPLTVKTHLHNIYRKLDAKNRIEALKKSREIGIIH